MTKERKAQVLRNDQLVLFCVKLFLFLVVLRSQCCVVFLVMWCMIWTQMEGHAEVIVAVY